jgi:hypothetical protein
MMFVTLVVYLSIFQYFNTKDNSSFVQFTATFLLRTATKTPAALNAAVITFADFFESRQSLMN